MKGLIRDDIANARLKRIQALINEQQIAFNQSSVGLSMPVLLDRRGKKAGQLCGRTPYNQSVYLEAPETALNTIVSVDITGGFDNSITGVLGKGEINRRSA